MRAVTDESKEKRVSSDTTWETKKWKKKIFEVQTEYSPWNTKPPPYMQHPQKGSQRITFTNSIVEKHNRKIGQTKYY